ncbi:MAG: hypothetical protein QOG64_345 [Acidimicrobiaceae bacterium]|nr:hypothetical protein [Acidimicrobiaceae bacterium]
MAWRSAIAGTAVAALGVVVAGCTGGSHARFATAPSSSSPSSPSSVPAAGTSPSPTTALADPTGSGAPCPPATAGSQGTAGSRDAAPPGDIPDNQAFVAYRSTTGGFALKVPEGWARSETQGGVTFTDKLNAIDVRTTAAPAAPTTASVQSGEVADLARTYRCFEPGQVTSEARRAGPAIRVTFRADSPADPVTAKVIRDDIERYEFWRNGTQATITLSSPVGSDNVDPWRTVTDSFSWSQ